MLRMSKLTDYAFVILAKMASKQEESWSAPTLAQATDLPLPTVAKLMKLLARGDFVTAQRGATGGYRLARPAQDISIISVLEIVEGPIRLTACADLAKKEHVPDCLARERCLVRENWRRINVSVREQLTHVSLSDLMAPLKEA